MNLVDPQGDTLRFAAGVSDAFRRAFAEAIQYMNASETSYNLAKLHSSSQVYYIDDGTRTGPSFSPSKHTVFWHPKLVFVSDNGVWISPVTQLAHEVKHAVNFDTSYAEYVTRKNLQDADYENEEERYVITTTEQYAARHHGEIDNNEVTRTNHSGNSNNYFVSKEKSLLDIIISVIENNYRNRTK